MDWGIRLKQLMDAYGYRNDDLVKRTGISSGYVTKLLKRKSPPIYKTEVKIASAFDLSLDEFRQKLNVSDSTNVPLQSDKTSLTFVPTDVIEYLPLLGYLPTTSPFPPDIKDAIGKIPIPRAVLVGVRMNGAYAVISKGDLHKIGIIDGDTIVVEKEFTFANAKTYIVQYGKDVILRHIDRENGYFNLVGEALEKVPAESIKIIGRAVKLVRDI